MINNSAIFFVFLLFKIVEKAKAHFSTLELKFKRFITTQSDDIILSNYNNDIYITAQIGTPRQNMEKIFLKTDSHEFMIANSTIEKSNYKKDYSYTSKLIVYPKYYSLKYTIKGIVLKDHFYLTDNRNNEVEFQNISFIYASRINNKIYTSVIGLKLSEEKVKKVKSFPLELKDLNYIKDTTWMIKYTSEDEGNFLIGEVLNEKNFPKFNPEDYRKTNTILFGNYLSWDLLFTKIEFNDVKLNGPMQANLDFNFGLISCSDEYYSAIKNELFDKYINEGKCKEFYFNKENENQKNMNINSKFNYIVCEKSFNVKKFPEISFYHTELDYVFTLSYEDVFISCNDKIYFLCINEMTSNERWRLGKPFFKKYNIIFDHSLKTIGIYGNINKTSINWVLLEWIVVIILFIIFVLLAYTLIRRYRLNHYKTFEKRIKTDELGDNFNEDNYKEFNLDNLQKIKEENKIIDD